MMISSRFECYKAGMRKLIASLDKDHPRFAEVLKLQSRLIENLTKTLEGGASPSLEADRMQILESCEQVSQDLLGKSFYDLCGSPELASDLNATASAQDIAPARQQDAILATYFDYMNGLLRDGGLRTARANDDVRHRARLRTLEILPSLDGVRKGEVVKFLYDSGLITQGAGVIFMSGANLEDVYLENEFLVEAHLAGVDLKRAHLAGAHLEWARLGEASLAGVDLKEAFLVAAHLGGADLVRADLRGASLVGANLAGAELMGANLAGAHLEWAYLVGANLEAANLSGASLMGAELMWARLARVDLAEADLAEADLSWAHLAWARLRDAEYDEHTRWPESFDPSLVRAILKS
jgi:uncharacterized protein YjbI with pentapeptide repeats